MKTEDFFGLDFNKIPFDINKYLELLGIKRQVENTGAVQRLILGFGKHSPYVDVAKRQQTLLLFKPLLSKNFLSYDKYHDIKDVNTASSKDRLYNAEERLLQITLAIASGKSYKKLCDEEFKPNTMILRGLDGYADEKYDRLRAILDKETKTVLDEFKQEKPKTEQKQKKSFLNKLFDK